MWEFGLLNLERYTVIMRCASAVKGAVVALVLTAGCGGSDQVAVYPVTGKVLVKGQPALGAEVMFVPSDPAMRVPGLPIVTGSVGADGALTLKSYAPGDGAPAGDYQVSVIWPTQSDPNNPAPQNVQDRLKGRYANPETSGLTAKVESAPTDLPPFEL